MRVKVNGEYKEITEGTTLEALLDGFGVKRQGIAVDVNREIIPKGAYASTVLKDGDVIEIIRMVGGG